MEEIKFKYEDGLCTAKNIKVDFLSQHIEIWVNTEYPLEIVSKKQKKVLKELFTINQSEFIKINKGLTNYANELLQKNIISGYLNLHSLKYNAIIIPEQNNTLDKYVFLFVDTTWKIENSDFVVELEIMIKNNKFLFLQKYTGLWTRIEWNKHYNKNQK